MTRPEGAAGRSGGGSDGVASAVASALAEEPAVPDGAIVVVGVSGGVDSTTLLHVLRFPLSGRVRPVAVHVDHRLRPTSADDAAWVRGLCAAWDVPVVSVRAEAAPASEEEGRDLRYRVFERVASERGATSILTAHHADDQAETVLFRVLRGTGIAGLAGIPARRPPGVVRPLLGVWREEIEAYARRVGLAWRHDVTNDRLGAARNVLRRRLLPEVERSVAPGARRALVRLARLSAEDEAAWAAVWERLAPSLDWAPDEGGDGETVDRAALLELPEPLRVRVVRTVAERVGAPLDEAGTRSAIEFISRGRSGRSLRLAPDVELRRRLGRIAFVRAPTPPPDRPLTIPDAGSGRGEVWLGGRCVPVSWGAAARTHQHVERFALTPDRFPVVVRARSPGDRMALAGGSKKLKKVFLEARIPSDRRQEMPVVLDAHGEVLWVPGVARASGAGEDALTLELGIG